ncbi:MAG: V-type ATP synthase subunit I [bacterium]|nr:V-type ATP synthase subunit I [bacterium]
MAIAPLKKIEVLGHASERDAVLEFLQREGNVEVIDLKDKSEEYRDFAFGRQSISYKEVTEAIEKLSYLMSFFEGLGKTKRSRFGPKPVLRRRELIELLRGFDFAGLHERCRGIESSLKNADKRRMELESRKKELLPWMAVDVPLDAIGETDYTRSALGSIRNEAYDSLREAIESLPDAHLEVVGEDRQGVFLFIAYLKVTDEEVTEVLRQHEVVFHHLPHYRGRAEEILKNIAAEEEQLESQRLAHLEEAKTLLPEEDKVAALLDYFSNLERNESTKDHLLYSQETFFLQGWIRAGDAPAAQRELPDRFGTVEVYVSEPSSDDVVPTLLRNRGWVRPFEFLTRIYGYPVYGGVDPTPFLSPFFFVFFGFCLGDAVYGLALVFVSILALKKLRMGWQGTRFFRLMFYCGVSATIVGALAGSWLGDLFGIPALVFNPMKRPVSVLNIALILGIIQIGTGYAAAAYGNIRRKQYKAALLDQLPIFVLLAGLTGIGLIFLGTVSKEAAMPFVILTVLGSTVILLASGRNQPSLFGKVFFGGLGVYWAVSGYLSDILSYSRLWALGLVTGAMASTLNLIASNLGGMIPVVGAVFTVIILVGGHIFTLAVNVLGAFVHSLRLQFVEFFSKFISSTGRPFRPLSIENRFVVLEE